MRFRPPAASSTQPGPRLPETKLKLPALPLAGWLGIFISFTGWVVIATFWPVQAAQAGFSTTVKGGVEFAFALSQALAALIIAVTVPGWYHRPAWLWLWAGCGAAGMLVFAFTHTAWLLVGGGMLYGIYTGSGFIYMVYHSMLDQTRSIKRVAINEVIVGGCFLVGPVLGNLLFSGGESFKSLYIAMAAIVCAGVAVQVGVALKTNRISLGEIPSGRKSLGGDAAGE
jgi:hypothetical protein